jgi:hypothetical protein
MDHTQPARDRAWREYGGTVGRQGARGRVRAGDRRRAGPAATAGGQPPRRPHGRFVHTLLPSGANIIDEMFPGLLNQLVESGAPSCTTTPSCTSCPTVCTGSRRPYSPSPPTRRADRCSRQRSAPGSAAWPTCNPGRLGPCTSRALRTGHAERSVALDGDADLVWQKLRPRRPSGHRAVWACR